MIDLSYRAVCGMRFDWWLGDLGYFPYQNALGWITVEHEGAEELRRATMREF